MTQFTPIASLFGGLLIGFAAILLMVLNGRIAGMTGILTAVIPPPEKDLGWRALFLCGAVTGPLIYKSILGSSIEFIIPVQTGSLVVGGLMVGIGVTYGSGCTSGHGVCGMARFSPRSIVATIVFMVATFMTVFVVRHVIG